MKKIKLKLFLTTLAASCIILGATTNSNAVLQSNGGTAATKNLDDWIVQIREMESSGGTLGKSETINTTRSTRKLLASTPSNGLDCHMEKNTEYGAMILLSASSYGKQSAIAAGETTTGNASGVVMKINGERVAAGAGATSTTIFKSADSRYINNDYGLTNDGKYHIGDAIAQGTWHSGKERWFSSSAHGTMVRAWSESVFSYNGFSGSSGNDVGGYTKIYGSRAVIVIGKDL